MNVTCARPVRSQNGENRKKAFITSENLIKTSSCMCVLLPSFYICWTAFAPSCHVLEIKHKNTMLLCHVRN